MECLPTLTLGDLTRRHCIYFVNLVVIQWFNPMAVRTRRQIIFQMPPMFNKNNQNLYLFPAILFALLMTFFIVPHSSREAPLMCP
ncbi:hypothetical protein V1506DRAFT_544502 [Lipomyces tetrasporus]